MRYSFRFEFDTDSHPEVMLKDIPLELPEGETWEWLYDIARDIMSEEVDRLKLEYAYGVHDWIEYIDDEDAPEEEQIQYFGFNTYEVPDELIPELMQLWEEILRTLGCKIL